MEAKKKRGRKSNNDLQVQSESTKIVSGTVEGDYSKSTYENGVLISFDIDWAKLAEHMKK